LARWRAPTFLLIVLGLYVFMATTPADSAFAAESAEDDSLQTEIVKCLSKPLDECGFPPYDCMDRLRKYGDKARPYLERALLDKATAANAAWVLVKMDEPIEKFQPALSSKDPEIRFGVLEGLTIDQSMAVDKLIAGCDDPDDDIRCLSVTALRPPIADADNVIKLLANHLQSDSSKHVRIAAAESLREFIVYAQDYPELASRDNMQAFARSNKTIRSSNAGSAQDNELYDHALTNLRYLLIDDLAGQEAAQIADHGAVRDKWALVVGTAKYGSGFSLSNVLGSSHQVSASLTEKANFAKDHVLDLKDASREMLIASINQWIGQNSRDRDLVLIYIAGICTTDSGTCYIMLSDSDFDRPGKSVSLGSLCAAIDACTEGRKVVLLLDLCERGAEPGLLEDLPRTKTVLVLARQSESGYTDEQTHSTVCTKTILNLVEAKQELNQLLSQDHFRLPGCCQISPSVPRSDDILVLSSHPMHPGPVELSKKRFFQLLNGKRAN